jgi:hypothetical protein
MADDGSGTAGTCGVRSHPAGTPVGTLAVVCRIQHPATTAGRPVLPIAAPPSRAEAVPLSADGTTRTSGGVGVGGSSTSPPPPGAEWVRFVGGAHGPVEQAVVESFQGRIVDRAGQAAAD